MKEIELSKKIFQGQQAHELLSHPLMKEALDDMRGALYEDIRNSKADATEKREHAYLLLKCVDLFESKLRKRIETGKMAKSILDSLKSKLRI